jgi:hypothetical protein
MSNSFERISTHRVETGRYSPPVTSSFLALVGEGVLRDGDNLSTLCRGASVDQANLCEFNESNTVVVV